MFARRSVVSSVLYFLAYLVCLVVVMNRGARSATFSPLNPRRKTNALNIGLFQHDEGPNLITGKHTALLFDQNEIYRTPIDHLLASEEEGK